MGSDSLSNGANAQWYLRLGDGGVFGPVSIATLVDWARQGRVMASNEVSNDNQNWHPAASLEELGMSWYIETASGALHGPFNRAAAELLARDGRLGSDVKIIPASEADLSKLCNPATPARNSASDPQGELDFGGGAETAAESMESIRDERESLRLQVNELEEKLRQMVRNAEKEARAQERQKESLRKTIAELEREQEDLRQSIAANGQNADSNSSLEDALETARREFADEKAMLEREADALRSRIAELEAENTAAQDANAADCTRLQSELSAAKAELAAAIAERAQLQSSAADCDRLQSELAAAKTELAAAVAEGAQLQSSAADCTRLQSELATAKTELESSRQEFAELLAASNERDAEYQRLIEEKEASQATAPDGTPIMGKMPPHLPVELAEAIDVIERVLAAEHDDFTAYRDATLKRQDMLRERVQSLRELRDAASDGVDSAETHTTGSARSFETSRLCDELDGLRLLHQRTVRQSEERERDLVRRVRSLESEETRLRARVSEADEINHRLRSATDSLHQREIELEQERYLRKVEQEQAQQVQKDLSARVEELERRINATADTELHPEAVIPSAVSSAAPVAQPVDPAADSGTASDNSAPAQPESGIAPEAPRANAKSPFRMSDLLRLRR